MVPSAADDTAVDTEHKDDAPSGDTAREEETREEDAREDSGSEVTTDEADSESSSDQGSGEKIGDRDDDDSRAAEPVDVAPDPEQTGIDVDKPPRLDELTEDEVEDIRKERLDPDNRPDNVEVDNTQRDFDTEMGRFEDSDADPPETAPFVDPEKPENQDDDGDDAEDSDDSGDTDATRQADGEGD
jgi:hypothetical protein